MNGTVIGLFIGILTLVIAIAARVEVRERRMTKLQTDVYYLRRDMDQILSLYRLTPAEVQDKKRRR